MTLATPSQARVMVFHPGLQHSHQLALGLSQRGRLALFCSGVPVTDVPASRAGFSRKGPLRRMKQVNIPRAQRSHPVIFYLLARVARSLPGWAHPDDQVHRVFRLFDYWVSRRLARLRPTMVVAYENSAYHTFGAAKKLGITCVLDAPSLHHQAADALIATKQTPARREINRRKDAEVAMADLVITCSQMAADTYVDAGVPAQKMKALLLGAELAEDNPAADAPADRVPRFIFAGAIQARKSVDLILEACARLHREGRPHELVLIGGIKDDTWAEQIARHPTATHVAGLAQGELFNRFRASDCLLLPSRFDAFGMVVVEAMACGIPAVVSTRTGAKEVIEQYPGSGWVVEPTADALYQQMRALLDDPRLLTEGKRAALTAASDFTWAAYRQRVGDLLCSLL